MSTMDATRRSPTSAAYRAGGVTLFIAIAVILAALAFQYIGGYIPCPLCLQQRYAYYAGIPLLFAALVLVSVERPRLAALVFFAVALAFLANAFLGTYHAGAEWKFWPGPQAARVPVPIRLRLATCWKASTMKRARAATSRSFDSPVCRSPAGTS